MKQIRTRFPVVALFVLSASLCALPGSVSARTNTVIRPPSPLSVRWLTPRAGVALPATVARNACAVDAQDRAGHIMRVDFLLDGTRVTRDYRPPYTCRFEAAGLAPGTHILKARAFDDRGNTLAAYQFVDVPWTGTPGSTVTVQGDSLTEGSWWRMPPYLGSGFELLSESAKVGRTTAVGLRILRHQRLGNIVVFALGTNDWWDTPAHYRSHIEDALRLVGPNRCLVVSSIWHSGPNAAFNAVLAQLATAFGPRRLQVAQWAHAVSAGEVRLPDGTHPTTQRGWELRSALVADAVRACAAATASPPPAPTPPAAG